jgi:ATP-dependent RNA helicase RhlE
MLCRHKKSKRKMNSSTTMTQTIMMLLLLSARSRTATAFLPSLRSPLLSNQHYRSYASMRTASRGSIVNAFYTTNEELSTLSVIELKDLLRQKGLKVSGKKYDLVQRLSSLAREYEAPKQEGKVVVPEITKPPSRNNNVKPPSRNNNVKPPSRNNVAASVSTDAVKNGFRGINVPPQLVKRLSEMGLENPTPIQRESIPHAIQGIDVMGLAQTGTGKTLAFGVPLVAQMLEKAKRPRPKAVHGLVLAPTRELANQIAAQLHSLTENTPISTLVVVGGQNIQTQINKLKPGTDLLVATPGRLIDLMDRKALSLSDTTFLVLDEADLMLDMGFLPSLRKVAKMLPKRRQTMLFSATMSKNMNEVASSYLEKPVRIEVARAGKTADNIIQELHFIARADKGKKLLDLLGNHPEDRTLVFGRTKHGMEKLSQTLIAAGFKAGSIHGNKTQPQRDRAIAAFKSGAIKVLVATDVAARGLDIPDVKHVYNYELPNVPEAYVHRIGRTGRAGKDGAAISFCSVEEMDDLLEIQKVTGIKMPVKSGTPWSKHETKLDKIKMKEKKLNQMGARRKGSNYSGDSKQWGDSNRKQEGSKQGSTKRSVARPRSVSGDGRGERERRTDQERRDAFARVVFPKD